VDRDASKKDRRKKMSGANKKMDRAVEKSTIAMPGETQGIESDGGLTPALQAHIGRHVRAVFDEVAREPIPQHLLRLLKDLEQSGDK
jgi:Anti-sigma factor NepR